MSPFRLNSEYSPQGDQAQAIAKHVQTLPVELTYREFAGAHELPANELVATLEWLQKLSTAPTAG